MDPLHLFIIALVLWIVLTLVTSVSVLGIVVIVESNVVKLKVVEVCVGRTIGGMIEETEGGDTEDIEGGGAIEESIDEVDLSVVSTVLVIFDEISDEISEDVSTGAAVFVALLLSVEYIESVEINLVVLFTHDEIFDLVSIVVEAAIDLDCLLLLVHFGAVVGAIVDGRISEYVNCLSDCVEDVVLVSSTVIVLSYIVVDSVDIAIVDGFVAALVVVSVISVLYSGVVNVSFASFFMHILYRSLYLNLPFMFVLAMYATVKK